MEIYTLNRYKTPLYFIVVLQHWILFTYSFMDFETWIWIQSQRLSKKYLYS